MLLAAAELDSCVLQRPHPACQAARVHLTAAIASQFARKTDCTCAHSFGWFTGCHRCDGAFESAGFERTWVSMRTITDAEVEAYVASGEWEGKAGGYAIQENADAFVTRLEEGGFDNVVGLPVELTLRLLAELELPR